MILDVWKGIENLVTFKKQKRKCPRVIGYIKKLYGMPLAEREYDGWQIEDERTIQMAKNLLEADLKHLVNMDEGSKKAAIYQLIEALIHCPNGQMA